MPYGQSPSLANSGTTTMSNANNNPRNMTASDYTRILKLRTMYNYNQRVASNSDVTNPAPGRSIDVFSGYGIGKYRRTASDWTFFKSAQTSDYVTMNDRGEPGMGKTLTVNKICICTDPLFSPSNIMGKDDICVKCKSRIVSTKSASETG